MSESSRCSLCGYLQVTEVYHSPIDFTLTRYSSPHAFGLFFYLTLLRNIRKKKHYFAVLVSVCGPGLPGLAPFRIYIPRRVAMLLHVLLFRRQCPSSLEPHLSEMREQRYCRLIGLLSCVGRPILV